MSNLYLNVFFGSLLILLFGCEQQERQSQRTASNSDSVLVDTELATAQEAISVVDFANQTVTLEQPARRIVALAPHIVENLFSIGAGDYVVGAMAHSDFPEAAQKLPSVGGFEQTNYERIVELKPDLIIAWQSGNSQGDVNKLRELGFKVFIDQPNSLDDIAISLRNLGELTAKTEEAERVARAFQQTLDLTRQQYAEKRPVSVFYQVWNEPLYTINGNHIISDAIGVCGGKNVFADQVAVAPRVNIESVIDSAPEVIIASGMGTARPEWLDDWHQWPSIPAVKLENLFFVNPDHLQRHTIRQLLAIDSICSQLDLARGKKS